MRKEKELAAKVHIAANEESITDSFPMMVILCLFFVVTLFHLFIIPNAHRFANWFAN